MPSAVLSKSPATISCTVQIQVLCKMVRPCPWVSSSPCQPKCSGHRPGAMMRLARQAKVRALSAGFTVVELLVSTAVIGLLLAITLPAVQQARQAASRMECISRLKQLALASHQYHDVYGHWPGARYQPLADLLPDLEKRPVIETDSAGRAAIRRLNSLLCPVDNNYGWSSATPFSYFVNSGSDPSEHGGFLPFEKESPLRIRDISDGLSATAMWSERRRAINSFEPEPQLCDRDPVRCFWKLTRIIPPGDEAAFVQLCLSSSDRVVDSLHDQREILGPNLGYSHALPPNVPSCSGTGIRLHSPATSHHARGVNVALCDGSVRFVSDQVSMDSWRAMGSRSGHEPLGDF